MEGTLSSAVDWRDVTASIVSFRSDPARQIFASGGMPMVMTTPQRRSHTALSPRRIWPALSTCSPSALEMFWLTWAVGAADQDCGLHANWRGLDRD